MADDIPQPDTNSRLVTNSRPATNSQSVTNGQPLTNSQPVALVNYSATPTPPIQPPAQVLFQPASPIIPIHLTPAPFYPMTQTYVPMPQDANDEEGCKRTCFCCGCMCPCWVGAIVGLLIVFMLFGSGFGWYSRHDKWGM